jgi:putative membrane protein
MRPKANDVIVGAAAGVIATVPMTLAMEELHRVLPGEHDGPLPPREVTEGLYDQLRGEKTLASEERLEQLTFMLHYAFGGAAGALFPLVAPRRVPAAVGVGILYGLTVWTGSYLGLLPAIGVRHHAKHDAAARSGMMIVAHVVWGATLGLLLRGRPGLRVASRHPDATGAR